MLTMMRGQPLLTLKVRGQRSRSQMTCIVKYPCEYDNDKNVVCICVKLDRHVNTGGRMNSIDFGGQKSKVKVTMDIY